MSPPSLGLSHHMHVYGPHMHMAPCAMGPAVPWGPHKGNCTLTSSVPKPSRSLNDATRHQLCLWRIVAYNKAMCCFVQAMSGRNLCYL